MVNYGTLDLGGANYLAEDMVVLVDDNDKPLGYAGKEKCHTVHNGIPGYHHRGLTVLVYNSAGKVLLQHRKHRIFDSVWDLAGSTHPYFREGRQETYEEAARRCLLTEYRGLSGVEVANSSIAVNYSAIDPSDARYCENEFCRLIVARHDGATEHNPENAYAHSWVAFPELLADVKAHPGRFAPWVVDLLEETVRRKPPELRSLVVG